MIEKGKVCPLYSFPSLQKELAIPVTKIFPPEQMSH